MPSRVETFLEWLYPLAKRKLVDPNQIPQRLRLSQRRNWINWASSVLS